MNNPFTKKFFFVLSAGLFLAILNVFAQTPQEPYDLANLRRFQPNFTVAYDRIKIQNSWEFINSKNLSLSQTILGIIESGIDRNHPEFSGVNLGRTPNELLTDPIGHGTAVCGIIGANNLSFTQTLPADSPQMNGVLSGFQGLNYVMGIRAISYIEDLETNLNDLILTGQARFINLSLGLVREESLSEAQRPFATELGAVNDERFNEWSNFFNDYIRRHPEVIFSIAAGNENVDVRNATPANSTSSNAIIVGATDVSNPDSTQESRAIWERQNGNIIQASNFGADVTIATPGTNVYAPATSTLPLDLMDYRHPNHPLGFFQGTSASAPFVTGTAAILKALEPEYQKYTPGLQMFPGKIKEVLMKSSDPIITDQPMGSGCFDPNNNPQGYNGCRLNAYRAVAWYFPPTSSTLSYSDLTPTSVKISWTKNEDPDSSEIRVLC